MNRRSVSELAPQTLRERHRSTTIETVLAAAEQVFADQGLHAAHMGEIASRAGVSVGTLYNHFKDREALLAGLLQAVMDGSLLAGIEATAPMFLMGMVRSLAIRDAMREELGDPLADAAELFDLFLKGARA